MAKPKRWPEARGGADRPPHIRRYQLPAEQIGYLTCQVEAHEGIGSVRTLDKKRGIVECWIMPDSARDFERLLADAAEQFPLQRVDPETI